MRILITFLIGIFLYGCSTEKSEMDASVIFYNKITKETAINEFKNAGIQYRVTGDQIWYSVNDAKTVRNLIRKAHKIQPIPYGFSNSVGRDKFLKALREAGIKSFLSDENEEYIVYVNPEDREKTSNIFKRMLLH